MDKPVENCRPISEELVAEWEQKNPERMAAARERVQKYMDKLRDTNQPLNITDITDLVPQLREQVRAQLEANFRGNPAFGDEDENA